MSRLREVSEIQLNEDVAFLRREWRAQRIGWIGMAVVLVLALLGLFGRGPISDAQIGDRNSFGVDYQRIVRHGAQTELEFHVAPALQSDSTFRIYLSQEYLKQFAVGHIVPEPSASGTAGALVFYEFARPNSRQAGRIVMSLTPVGLWRRGATVGVPGASALRFSQFVLP